MPRRPRRSPRQPSTAYRLSQSRRDPEPAPDDTLDAKIQIARINEISLIARTTWFGLLAYLAFVGVTLLGVEDADFFVPSRQTQLPLVNVAIPTSSFFWFAPMLGAALYAYLHLQLLKLWEALAKPPPIIDNRPLSDHIYPWLISDFALSRRTDDAIPKRPLRLLSSITTRLLVWWSAPILLIGFWWRSMPAHHEGMTLWISAFMCLSIYVGLTSNRKMKSETSRSSDRSLMLFFLRHTMFVAFAIFVMIASWTRTEGGIDRIVNSAISIINNLFSTDYFQDCPDSQRQLCRYLNSRARCNGSCEAQSYISAEL